MPTAKDLIAIGGSVFTNGPIFACRHGRDNLDSINTHLSRLTPLPLFLYELSRLYYLALLAFVKRRDSTSSHFWALCLFT